MPKRDFGTNRVIPAYAPIWINSDIPVRRADEMEGDLVDGVEFSETISCDTGGCVGSLHRHRESTAKRVTPGTARNSCVIFIDATDVIIKLGHQLIAACGPIFLGQADGADSRDGSSSTQGIEIGEHVGVSGIRDITVQRRLAGT